MGILSARWRIYKRPFECKLQTVDKIVLATCALHNFLGGHGNISSEEITTSLEETSFWTWQSFQGSLYC
ncbi:hypothetical protein JTE90_018469 [Oedothorax gibbosus]|uniref:DDE Tnp4 domain-containing protein n=1 Tax=Oedothorax gibbosus TaxID=931172 RepID=A0AAV6UFM5_9ARAC|nr:hypothetical protein JTE90_018469 [Oedothorax gibbosus]